MTGIRCKFIYVNRRASAVDVLVVSVAGWYEPAALGTSDSLLDVERSPAMPCEESVSPELTGGRTSVSASGVGTSKIELFSVTADGRRSTQIVTGIRCKFIYVNRRASAVDVLVVSVAGWYEPAALGISDSLLDVERSPAMPCKESVSPELTGGRTSVSASGVGTSNIQLFSVTADGRR